MTERNSSTMFYQEWQAELVELITADTGIDEGVRQAEIEAAWCDAFNDSYDDGDTPSEAWEHEKSTMPGDR